MAISKEQKQDYFDLSVKLAFKAAEGGASQKPAELAQLIRDAYHVMVEIHDEVNKG